jgi:hypothetical protein
MQELDLIRCSVRRHLKTMLPISCWQLICHKYGQGKTAEWHLVPSRPSAANLRPSGPHPTESLTEQLTATLTLNTRAN